MKREELDAIRKRAEAATPGPWKYFECADAIVCDDYTITEELSLGYDGIFIANARQDVPVLLAEVERCEAALRELGPEGMGEFDPALLPIIRVTR